MIRERASLNFDDRRGHAIDTIVLHYTGMATAEAALARLTDKASAVSAHYLIDEDGTIYQLVNEQRRAWHAGISWWRGAGDVNSRSIGIELVNPGHEFGYRPFPEPQIHATIALCRAIIDRYAVPARNVVGHSDVAPRRKNDPGELFDWPALAREGVGLWPGEAESWSTDIPAVLAALAAIGYETDDPTSTIIAFQRRFHPRLLTGQIDNVTAKRVFGLLAACGSSE